MHILAACSAPPLQQPGAMHSLHTCMRAFCAQHGTIPEIQPCAHLQVNKVSEVVTSLADPSANVIFGAVIDDQYEGEIHVTIIATGFSQNYEEAVLTGKAMDVPPTPSPSPTSSSGSLPWNRRSGTFRQTLLS